MLPDLPVRRTLCLAAATQARLPLCVALHAYSGILQPALSGTKILPLMASERLVPGSTSCDSIPWQRATPKPAHLGLS